MYENIMANSHFGQWEELLRMSISSSSKRLLGSHDRRLDFDAACGNSIQSELSCSFPLLSVFSWPCNGVVQSMHGEAVGSLPC